MIGKTWGQSTLSQGADRVGQVPDLPIRDRTH
jgi:hypothetical protein